MSPSRQSHRINKNTFCPLCGRERKRRAENMSRAPFWKVVTLKILSPTQESHLDLETRAAQTAKNYFHLASARPKRKRAEMKQFGEGREHSRFYYKSRFLTATWRTRADADASRDVFCLFSLLFSQSNKWLVQGVMEVAFRHSSALSAHLDLKLAHLLISFRLHWSHLLVIIHISSELNWWSSD